MLAAWVAKGGMVDRRKEGKKEQEEERGRESKEGKRHTNLISISSFLD